MKPILEIQERPSSLAEDPTKVLAFKVHAGLPTFSQWTEKDPQIKSYLKSAERHVSIVTGCPYGETGFSYQLSCLPEIRGRVRFRLPIYPITGDTTIDWTDKDGNTGQYTEGEEFGVYGKTTLTPEIIFLSRDFDLPDVSDVVYPFTVNFTAGPCAEPDICQMAIFELAAYYWRFPEAVNETNPKVGQIYEANIDLLSNHFI